jgi:hypothetical protein
VQTALRVAGKNAHVTEPVRCSRRKRCVADVQRLDPQVAVGAGWPRQPGRRRSRADLEREGALRPKTCVGNRPGAALPVDHVLLDRARAAAPWRRAIVAAGPLTGTSSARLLAKQGGLIGVEPASMVDRPAAATNHASAGRPGRRPLLPPPTCARLCSAVRISSSPSARASGCGKEAAQPQNGAANAPATRQPEPAEGAEKPEPTGGRTRETSPQAPCRC